MNIFWKTVGGILIALVLSLSLGKREGDLALVLSMAVCCMAAVAAMSFLEPVLSFLQRLEQVGDLQSGVLGILLKMLGVGLVSELASGICQDGGNSALARGVQLLGSAVMLQLSLPVFETLLELVQQILGEA